MPTYFQELHSHISELNKKPIIQLLQTHGRVFLIGGYIRDVLGGEKPNDIDLFVLTSHFEALLKDIEKTKLYLCISETSVNYEGLKLSGIQILHTRDKNHEDPVDIIVSSNFDVHNTDFDVNSMYLELTEDAKLSTLVGDSLVPMDEEKVANMIMLIKAKRLNISPSVEYLMSQKGKATGEKQFMKRCVKRINKGWTFENNQHNIDVVKCLLNNVSPFGYMQQPMTRYVRICMGHMLRFLTQTGPDHKDFFKEIPPSTFTSSSTSSTTSSPDTSCKSEEKKGMWGFESRFAFFEDLLNYLANKHPYEISPIDIKFMMEYYGTKYVRWDNCWERDEFEKEEALKAQNDQKEAEKDEKIEKKPSKMFDRVLNTC